MNWFIYHIASGHCFFTGIILLVAAASLSLRSGRLSRYVPILAVLSLISLAISATPLPLWSTCLLAVAVLLWAGCFSASVWKTQSSFLLVIACLCAAGSELPFHFYPNIEPTRDRAITVIGDSVTAGVSDSQGFPTWPEILRKEKRLSVQDLSHVGETVSSAASRLKKNPAKFSLVLIELGGNDLLGSSSLAEFKTGLDDLLQNISKQGRQIILFELPLPPFFTRYGKIQRELAAKYDCLLIPKSELMKLFSAKENTLDSIHLSQRGQERMAESVWKIIGQSFR